MIWSSLILRQVTEKAEVTMHAKYITILNLSHESIRFTAACEHEA